jgi:hypothetical protein
MSVVRRRENPLLHNLLHLVRKQPDVRSCIQRLSNACMAGDISCKEGGRVLSPKLLAVVRKHYRHFLHSALEQSFACGFCAFHVRRERDVPLPFVLPLGSFSWSVEPCEPHSKKRKYEDGSPICRYRIQVLHGNIKESDVHIVNFDTPMFVRSTGGVQPDALFELQSPLAHVLEKFEIVRTCMRAVFEINKWNVDKHLVVTEKLELKDQTTSGIHLLDEFRRYSLAGTHGQLRDGILKLRTRDHKDLSNVNEAALHWMQDQFNQGEKEAKVHMLPPNMEVQELNNIDHGRELQFFQEDFLVAVYAFFDLPRVKDMGSSQQSSASNDAMSRQQYLNVLHLCRHLEHVAEAAYAVSFHIDMRDVTFSITPQNRLEINSAADVKALCDAEVFPLQSRAKLQKLYHLDND